MSTRKPAMFMDIHCKTCGGVDTVVDGAYLRWKRQRAGMTLRDLGKKLGVSAVYLSDIELNRRNRLPRVVEGYKQHCAEAQAVPFRQRRMG